MKYNCLALLGTALIATLAVSSSYAADKKSTIIDYARVTHVEPVYRYVTVNEPQRQCRFVRQARERRHHYDRRHNHPQRRFISGESIIQNSSASHNSARSRHSTGSATTRIFDQADNKRHHNRNLGNHRNRLVERCVTTLVSRQERRHNGYNVTYVYRGNTYQARTDQHPGNKIRVRVEVKPH